MNFKRWLGIVYNRMAKWKSNQFLVYQPVPAPIDKIKNKFRWRMIIKCRVNAKILDMIKWGIEDKQIQKMKNTSVIVDINPNNLT